MKVQVNELRIGSYYSYDDDAIKLDGSFLAMYLQNDTDLHLYSIRIREEWLLKFGFTHNKSNDSWQLDSELGFSIWGRIGKGFYIYVESDEIGNPIYYVHELQNTWFALIGSELTLKE